MKFILDVTIEPGSNPQDVADQLLDWLCDGGDEGMEFPAIQSFDNIEVAP